MKHLLSMIVFLMAISWLCAIAHLPGSGRSIQASSRDYHLAYHNSVDELHFYGSNTWAVRFDFANYFYPNLQDLDFTINSLKLWFPQQGDSVSVKLMSDGEGQPVLPEIASFKVPVDDNNLVIPLPEPITLQKMWMLVQYDTFFNGPFVSASSGGGTHSYYLNTSLGTPFFQSLAQAGFNAELLFGVSGEFVLLQDLALVDIDFVGGYKPRETVYPRFVIHNHSDQYINGLNLNLSLSFPISSLNVNRIIALNQAIPPYADFVWDQDQDGFFQQGITIPEEPMQARLRGSILPQTNQDSYAPNNSLDKYVYSFTDEPPIHLVENFFRDSNASSILNLEADILADAHYEDIHVLNYFPVLADSLSSTAAMNHFSWYGFNTLPRVVFGGEKRIIGLSSGFAAKFEAQCDSLSQQRSFISHSTANLEYSAENIDMRFSFNNQNTRLLSGSGNYDLVRNSVFFAAVFKQETYANQSIWNLKDWIFRASPISASLNIDERLDIDAEIPTLGLDPQANYRIYYWLQEKMGGRIHFANMVDLTLPTANDELLQKPAKLSISPNPLKGKSSLNVDSGSFLGKGRGELKIYNIKGQLVYSQKISQDENVIQSQVFPHSGIYFICIQNGKGARQTAKVSIIK